MPYPAYRSRRARLAVDPRRCYCDGDVTEGSPNTIDFHVVRSLYVPSHYSKEECELLKTVVIDAVTAYGTDDLVTSL
ncbi:hypothetical protein EVAR_5011_1 [Eumeta japonica]|uniref:Uncharacterized protein n=1 Tax=Eumeta variegata TaxID=151549 RepID=A0A4C1SWW9_EUMVA|nr:hypothetical protein EVAR_5011_1 [Eumeta japonica]